MTDSGGAAVRSCESCGTSAEYDGDYCGNCGRPLSEPRLPTQAARRPLSSRGGSWVAPAIAILAAVVGIIVIIAAAVWIGGQPGLPPPGSSTIELGAPTSSGNVVTVPVTYVSPPVTPAALLVSLDVNGTMGGSAPMPTTSGLGGETAVSAAGYGFRVAWWDTDGDGALSTGDAFGLTPQTAMPGCCAYVTFYILWKAGGLLGASVRFYPAPVTKPFVAFGAISRGTRTNVYIPVANVSPPAPALYLYFRLRISTNESGAVAFPALGNTAANLSFWGGEYIVAWYDTNQNELFDRGDSLNVTMVSGTWPSKGTPMAFILEWSDRTDLAVATWTA